MTFVATQAPAREAMSVEKKARFLQVGLLVFGLAFWEMAMRTGLMAYLVPNPGFWFSSPSAIATLIWKLAVNGQLWNHVWLTFSATLIGLGLGAVIGILLGVLMAQSTRLETLFDPIWSALNALPKVALAPAFAASFGIGIASKSALAVAIVVFVFLFNTTAGLRAINPTLICNLKLMGASRLQILRMAMLPSLVRWLYGALRISLGLALTAVVVGEFVAARGGIGFIIQYGFGMFNVTWCYAGIVLLGIIALATDAVMRIGEYYLTRWERS
jgi:NitT/TauT family transport system permease protein